MNYGIRSSAIAKRKTTTYFMRLKCNLSLLEVLKLVNPSSNYCRFIQKCRHSEKYRD
jgi:hypothetical protein